MGNYLEQKMTQLELSIPQWMLFPENCFMYIIFLATSINKSNIISTLYCKCWNVASHPMNKVVLNTKTHYNMVNSKTMLFMIEHLQR